MGGSGEGGRLCLTCIDGYAQWAVAFGEIARDNKRKHHGTRRIISRGEEHYEQQDDLSIRPALAGPLPDVAGATTVFLGYPIWWGKVSRVVLTYVESGALSGKTVVPFCTSGSSGIEGSLSELEFADASVAWEPGHRFDASVSETTIDEFVTSYAE